MSSGIVVTGDTPAELLTNAKRIIKEGGIDHLLVELCCSESSQLAAAVPPGAAAIRVTEKVDLTKDKTVRVIKDIIKKALEQKIRVLTWVAVPCTAGCPWRHINKAKGLATGDAELTDTLTKHCLKLCRCTRKLGGDFCWEWPQRCDLWGDPRVYDLVNESGGKFCMVSSSAVGLSFIHDGRQVYLKKKWCIYSTDPALREAFSEVAQDKHEDSKTFVVCKSRYAKESAHYPEQMANMIWRARAQRDDRQVAAVSAASPVEQLYFAEHRERDLPPRQPLWCSLVTRVVKPKSSEAQCEGAKQAVKAELDNMNAKKVWDTDDVYSLTDLLQDPKISEAMLGRAFTILGVKGEELDDTLKKWKARIVFQGSNIRTKTGTSAADLFEEVSNAPASFAASRAALGVGVLKGFRASLRDAEAAYLQALLDTPNRTPTFVELPREWWPDSWFHDGALRQQPKYFRPHCRLKKALYGHPEAGALWEKALVKIMQEEGWESVPLNPGVFVHKDTGAFMIVYVDDMLMLASFDKTSELWRQIEKKIRFKDPEEDICRYLGARHTLDPYDPKQPQASRIMMTDMDSYTTNAIMKFKEQEQVKLPRVSSPFLTKEEWAQEGQPGIYSESCASYVATLLFLSRVARPDISVAVQRLCKVVTKWTTTHDAAILRLYGYLDTSGPMALRGELSPKDLQDVEIAMWTDADWCGDAEDTKSTSGMLLEIHCPSSGRRWPVCWAVRKQGATSSSTAEAETVSLAYYTKHEGIPMQILIDALLAGTRPPIRLVALVDNTQAIAAVQKGYSKKLRFLERTHKCSINTIHELLQDGTIEVEYAPTATHRGDGFTKAMEPAKFQRAIALMGMVSAG